jgi:hypothetical protein
VPHSKAEFQSVFPNLSPDSFEKIAEEDPDYNCIAWAASDTTRWWWPRPPGWPAIFNKPYWPTSIASDETLATFIELFNILGYELCQSDIYEEGFERIAIYVLNGVVKHASRQLSNGRWSSKVGEWEMIEHDFNALDGIHYGAATQIMKKKVVM